jgi:hypothetical protein
MKFEELRISHGLRNFCIRPKVPLNFLKNNNSAEMAEPTGVAAKHAHTAAPKIAAYQVCRNLVSAPTRDTYTK